MNIRYIIGIVMSVCVIFNAQPHTVKLRILQTSDVHGNFYPYDFITSSPMSGSLARVSAAVKEARADSSTSVILLDNGDILQEQPTAYYYNYVDTLSPHPAAQMLEYIGYTAANIGNHDIETGREVLERWASQCSMPVLGANIIDTATGKPAFTPYTVVEFDSIKVTILGMITPAIPAWLPEQLWKGLKFDDMEESARQWIPYIQHYINPDLIIGIFHSGQNAYTLNGFNENASLTTAHNVPGFDIVLMGHDHRKANMKITNIAGDTVTVVNPANNALVIGDISVTFDIDEHTGKVASRTIDSHLSDISSIEPDSAFLRAFARERLNVERYVSTPITILSNGITTRDSYFGPSEFVDLIHTIQLDITGADISMAAPLSFDATVKAGPLTMADLFNLYKYENLLYIMNLTGHEIKNYLEYSYAMWTDRMQSKDSHLLRFASSDERTGDQHFSRLAFPSYNFDSAAGIIYDVDVTKPTGQKIIIRGMADGRNFDADSTYRVALNSYRGNGGGELLTKGTGIPLDQLKSRIVWSTDRDLRHYIAMYLSGKEKFTARRLNHWRFIPEEWTHQAAMRDREILFGK